MHLILSGTPGRETNTSTLREPAVASRGRGNQVFASSHASEITVKTNNFSVISLAVHIASRFCNGQICMTCTHTSINSANSQLYNHDGINRIVYNQRTISFIIVQFIRSTNMVLGVREIYVWRRYHKSLFVFKPLCNSKWLSFFQ